MTRSMIVRLLAAASVAALIPAQSAAAPAQGLGTTARVAERAQDSRSPQGETSDRIQIRLAEVMAMLEEEQMSPELQQKALAKLNEVAQRLKKERAAAGNTRVMGLGGATQPAVPPVLFRRFPDSSAPARAAEVEEPPPPPPAPEAPRARVFRARVAQPAPEVVLEPMKVEDMNPVMRVYRTKGDNGDEARVFELQAKDVQEKQIEATKAQIEAVKVQIEDAKRKFEVAQDQNNNKVRVLMDRIGAEKKAANEAKARADSAKAKAQHEFEVVRESRADAGSGQARGRGRSVEVDDDDADIRATIEQMRSEMREIRKLMQDIRNRAKDEAQHDSQPVELHEVQDLAPASAAAPIKVRALKAAPQNLRRADGDK